MKKTMKRLTALALTTIMAISAAPTITAGAATIDNDIVQANSSTLNQQNSAQILLKDSLYEQYPELCDRIAEGISNLDEYIFVGDIDFPAAQLPYIMKTVVRTHPELFFINAKQFAVGGDANKVAVIVPIYLNDKDEITIQRKRFDARVAEILSLVTDDMTDLEKALVVHDEIALNCTYVNDDKTGVKNTSAYNSLVEGRANCQGYTEGFSYLLKNLGITTEIVESLEMNHVWNNVLIDGNFYNVDVTWDDPVPNKEGHVNHKFFLLSDEAVIKNGNYGFPADYCVSNSKKYDNALFHEIDTRFCRIDNNFYVIDNAYGSKYQNCLLNINPVTDEAVVVENFNYKWKAGENSSWRNTYMSLEVQNGGLYFNSPDGIYRYDVNTNNLTAINSEGVAAGNPNENYYGLIVKGDEIYVATAATPNNEFTLHFAGKCINITLTMGIGVKRTVTIDGTKFNIINGDMDLDGEVTITDATSIQKHTAQTEVYSKSQIIAADVNGDGEANIMDCTDIQKFIVGLI